MDESGGDNKTIVSPRLRVKAFSGSESGEGGKEEEGGKEDAARFGSYWWRHADGLGFRGLPRGRSVDRSGGVAGRRIGHDALERLVVRRLPKEREACHHPVENAVGRPAGVVARRVTSTRVAERRRLGAIEPRPLFF